MIVREDRIREWALYSTPVMFPTSHDITQSVYAPCLEQLKNLLRAGNEVLIGTKPRFWVIERLISDLYKYRKQVSFQFTISTLHDKRIRMWEPGASRVAERLKCLQMAKKARYQTNVSIEPCLDVEDVHAIVDRVNPWVTDTIWVGPLNVKKEFEDFNLHIDCNLMKQWWGAPMRRDHERLLIKYGDKVQFTKAFHRKMQR